VIGWIFHLLERWALDVYFPLAPNFAGSALSPTGIFHCLTAITLFMVCALAVYRRFRAQR
jgi:hypothetical protein